MKRAADNDCVQLTSRNTDRKSAHTNMKKKHAHERMGKSPFSP